MGADKGKKQKVDEENNIDGDLVFSIEKLQEIQDELEKINEEASDEVLEVEQKYNEVRKPFLNHPVLGELLTEEDQKEPDEETFDGDQYVLKEQEALEAIEEVMNEPKDGKESEGSEDDEKDEDGDEE
uniref:Uncharacterized protein n=1 Tax=Solanum lycopersicum TaxID=4081 RepID=A0A3Q7JBE4_SOLLC